MSAVTAIQAEWLATERNLRTRMKNLDGTGNGPRENDQFFLELGKTVLHDRLNDK